MLEFIVVFFVFAACILAMAVGVIFSGRRIQGSCGGISALGLKRVCDCEQVAQRRAQAAQVAQAKITPSHTDPAVQIYRP